MDGRALLDVVEAASSIHSLVRASLSRLINTSLRHAPCADIAPVLRALRATLRGQKPSVALRRLDRAWRCHPEAAATLAPLYARLLVINADDGRAALHLLRRSMDFGPDPEGAALIAWVLKVTQEDDAAQQQLSLALGAYATAPGELLFEVASALLRQLPDAPGWIGRRTDMGILGELRRPEDAALLEIELNGQRFAGHLVQMARRSGRATFALERRTSDAAGWLDAQVRDTPLLGSGSCIPAGFHLGGRSDVRNQRLYGWARLGWAPRRALDIAIEDERGRYWVAEIAATARVGGGTSFQLDLAKGAPYGNRLTVSALLPDGRWQALPDSPVWVEVAQTDVRGNLPRLRPWGIDPVRLGPPAAVPTRAPGIDIIIPIYRDRSASLACIDSVLQTVPAGASIVVVDDATEDDGLAAALDEFAAEGHITLLRNSVNLGFVASVNRGMALHPTHDSVLLNSDTRVFGDWLPRLCEAAYSEHDVGSVTPFSNNGSIASYPREDGWTIDVAAAAALHTLAAASHPGVRIPLPVGVGFCLYLRRDCLTEVGPFDAALFGKGYGEEVDFCVRARRRGWSHRLAADVFVYHAGGLSFGDRREALLERSHRLLNLRHPGFDRLIARFLEENPLRAARRTLDEQRLRDHGGRYVLLVTLALAGGVERFVEDRVRTLRAQGLCPLILKPAAPGALDRCRLSTESLDVPNLVYDIPSQLEALTALLRQLPIEAMEIQHFLHLDARVIDAVRALPVPYDVVVHDYAWICPRITLIDGRGSYCGEPAVAACETCLSRNGSELGEVLSVAALRTRSATWLRAARRVIAPSQDTAARLRRHFRQLSVEVQDHAAELSLGSPYLQPQRSLRATVRIALIGAIGEHKGYKVLLECAKHARRAGLPLEFVVIGYTEDDPPLLTTGKVFVTGRYTDEEVAHLLQREQPDAIWLPSVWPETWCYALDHALATGLPVAAFDLGAIAERLRATGRGELLPLDLDASHINERLLALARATSSGVATASRSSQVSLALPPDGSSMGLTNSGENDMKNATDDQTAAPVLDEGLSASVQVLELGLGLYLFSVKAAGSSTAGIAGRIRLPAMHVGLGPGVAADHVQFMSGHATEGSWLFATTDQLVVKVMSPGALFVLTSVRAPTGDVLSIKVERLSSRAEAQAPTPAQAAVSKQLDTRDHSLSLQIETHIRSRGDMKFTDAAWAGRVASGLWIESFSVRPLEQFEAKDVEYKGLTGSGHETPWLTDNQPCGTQGMGVPLVGFAVRFKPSAAASVFNCEYHGYFQSGLTVGPLMNGAPCRSTVANDPLEGIRVRLVKRIPKAMGTVSPEAGAAALSPPAAPGPALQGVPDGAARTKQRRAQRHP